MKPLTHCIGAGFLVLGSLAAIGPAAGARPEYHEQFLSDPLRSAEAEGCGVCQLDAAGGGPRGDFGERFESAGLVITPMMRASFPELFDVPEAPIGERGTLHFADPNNRSAIVEMDGESFVIDLPEGVLNVVDEDEIEEESIGSRAPGNFSFFVTSVGLGRGGNLGGIAGADLHCQSLAEAVGAGQRTWRAYLSTSFESQPAINAGDRIGTGPWHNIRGIRIARGVAELHSEHNNLDERTALTETGAIAGRHDILTGTLADGMASTLTCENWTTDDEGQTVLGHFDRQGGGDNGSSWNSAHTSAGCSQQAFESTGGDGLFYCFAID